MAEIKSITKHCWRFTQADHALGETDQHSQRDALDVAGNPFRLEPIVRVCMTVIPAPLTSLSLKSKEKSSDWIGYQRSNTAQKASLYAHLLLLLRLLPYIKRSWSQTGRH